MQIAQLLSVVALCVAVILLALAIRRAHYRISVLEAKNCNLFHQLMVLNKQLCELDKGLRQATKMGIAAHKRNAVAIKRCDGITHKLLDLIKTNHLKTTKK